VKAKLRHSWDIHHQLTKPLLVGFHTGHVTRLCRILERCWLYDTSFAISADHRKRERLIGINVMPNSTATMLPHLLTWTTPNDSSWFKRYFTDSEPYDTLESNSDLDSKVV